MAEGLIRRYREEFVLAGVPVYTRTKEFNHYCPACATTELTNPIHKRDTLSEPTEEQVTTSESETDHS